MRNRGSTMMIPLFDIMSVCTTLLMITSPSLNNVASAFTSPNAHSFVSKPAAAAWSPITTKVGALSSSNDNAVDDLLFRSVSQEGGGAADTIRRQQQQSQSRADLATVKRGRSSSVVLPDSSAAPSVLFTSSAAATLPQEQAAALAPERTAEAPVGDETTEDFMSRTAAPPAPEDTAASAAPGATADGGFDLNSMQMPSGASAKDAMLQYRKEPISLFGIRFTTGKHSFQKLVDEKDYNTILLNYAIPITLVGTVAVMGVKKGIEKYSGKVDDVLASYADEMIYHDGDFEEMQMCHNDYSRRLKVLTTPFNRSLKTNMISSVLELYSKKKPVSPRAVSSLSHVLTMYKLSEETAANIICKVASSSMTDKLASAGKLLFFGERILKSAAGQKALQPVRDLLIEKNGKGGKVILETSLKAMAEAAYRNTVTDAGKDQEELTVGWEILGLSRETAERIFAEAAEQDFKSRREMQFATGAARQKYDDKGRKITDDGKLVNPAEATDDDDDDDDGNDDSKGPSGTGTNVYECTECGYTLFPAKGREGKFFPAGFSCPECGCGKDKFEGR